MINNDSYFNKYSIGIYMICLISKKKLKRQSVFTGCLFAYVYPFCFPLENYGFLDHSFASFYPYDHPISFIEFT